MNPAGDRLIAVQLVEDGDEEALLAAAPGSRPLARRVPGRAWAAVAALIAVGVAGWTVAEHLDERAVDARLAAVDGLSASLEAPLVPVWRVTGGEVLAAVGDAVLVQDADRDGIRAVASADGTVRYSLPGLCRLVGADATTTSVAPSQVREAGDAELLLCVETTPTEAEPTARSGTARVHDPSTGVLLRSIDLGPVATSSPVGSDVVSIGVAADRHVVAGRWSLLTGEPVWSHRSPSPVPSSDDVDFDVDETFVRLRISGWSLTLDTATGERVGRVRWGFPRDTHVAWGPVPLPDGGSAASRFASGVTTTTVLEPNGSERFDVPGFLLAVAVDDGTAPGTLLVVRPDPARGSRALAALDVADGSTRWTSTPRLGEVAVVGRSVVVHDPSGITALDAADGAVRWTAPAGDRGDPGWGMAIDGRRVLTLDQVAGDPRLTARDLATGSPLWSAAAPLDDASLAVLPDGTVLATGPRDVLAMRPGGA